MRLPPGNKPLSVPAAPGGRRHAHCTQPMYFQLRLEHFRAVLALASPGILTSREQGLGWSCLLPYTQHPAWSLAGSHHSGHPWKPKDELLYFSHCHPHCTDVETEAQRGEELLLKIIVQAGDMGGLVPRALDSKSGAPSTTTIFPVREKL